MLSLHQVRGMRLRGAISFANVSQRHVSEAVSVSETSLSRFLQGTSSLDPSVTTAIAEYLASLSGASAQWLLDGVGSPPRWHVRPGVEVTVLHPTGHVDRASRFALYVLQAKAELYHLAEEDRFRFGGYVARLGAMSLGHILSQAVFHNTVPAVCISICGELIGDVDPGDVLSAAKHALVHSRNDGGTGSVSTCASNVGELMEEVRKSGYCPIDRLALPPVTALADPFAVLCRFVDRDGVDPVQEVEADLLAMATAALSARKPIPFSTKQWSAAFSTPLTLDQTADVAAMVYSNARRFFLSQADHATMLANLLHGIERVRSDDIQKLLVKYSVKKDASTIRAWLRGLENRGVILKDGKFYTFKPNMG